MIIAENELAMSGTTMPRLPVRRRASERATGFGAYRSSSAASSTRRRVPGATASGWVNTRETVAGETPARAATSRIVIAPPTVATTV